MHEAFELIRLVDKLPLKICALATWDDSFVLSTVSPKNDAHLLIYDIKDGGSKGEAKLVRTLKKFTEKPITQLAVIPEHRLIIALSDGEVFCADLDSYSMKKAIGKTKGVSCFAVDWQTLRVQCERQELRICVASKKKLSFFEYKKGDFIPYKNELSLFDVPKAVAWVGKSVVVCIKKDLHLINHDTGEPKELFSIGKDRTEPCLLQLIRGEILILKDELQVSIDQDGNPTQVSAINWSEPPISVELVEPYIIGILPRGVEVRAFEQKTVVQLLRTNDVKLLASHKNTVIAESNVVYKLEPKSYDVQVQELVKGNNFELALQIVGLIQEEEVEKKLRRHDIIRKQAFYQFSQLEFEESLKNFLTIQEDPIRVIGLYPSMLPSELRSTNAANYPSKPITLVGKELDDATKHLQKYLTQLRYQENQKLQKIAKEGGNEEVESKIKKTLELIDTTLLKCYTKTNNSTLLESLIRLDNHLNLVECEKVLKSECKYQELVGLYKSKGQHEKALRLLADFSRGPAATSLQGLEPTINYLQTLGKDNLTLILEYSKLVIKERPADALRIFTEESVEVEGLPRDKVLEHLRQNARDLVLPYLEHVISRWKDNTPLFHNTLLRQYTTQTKNLLCDHKRASPVRKYKAGEEPDDIGKMRKKLLQFIETSKYYQPEEHLSSLPPDDMFEERALLLSRIGYHEAALAIYVHVLNDQPMAEEYCRKNYDPEKERNKHVYLYLLKMYTSPPDLVGVYGIRPPGSSPRPAPNLRQAISILTTYHCQIDTTQVLKDDIIPPETPLKDLKSFLTTVLEETTVQRRKTQILKGLLLAEHLQVQQQKMQVASPHFIIQDSTVCAQCKKKLGTSAFARYPDGVIEHYYCAKMNQQEGEKTVLS